MLCEKQGLETIDSKVSRKAAKTQSNAKQMQEKIPGLSTCYDAHMEVVQTERLVLRHFTLDDAEFILALLNEPGWKRYIGDRGINSLNDARTYIEAVSASYSQHGFGLYAVELRDDRSLVGMCGLIKRDTLDDVDVGFALLSRFEGRGFAQEAVNATLEYARDRLGLSRVIAITTEDNIRSTRVLERAGMSYEGTVSLSGDTLNLYGITAENLLNTPTPRT